MARGVTMGQTLHCGLTLRANPVARQGDNMQYFVVDAFTDRVLGGNPAGVCLVDDALDAATMQAIAAENNLSETAFLTRTASGWSLRWFTPTVEIDLCGHATLAAGFVVTSFVEPPTNQVSFVTRAGTLRVAHHDGWYTLDFPARPARPVAVTAAMVQALGAPVVEAHLARDLMLVLAAEEQVRRLAPDIAALAGLADHAVIVTAPARQVDFVSRFFAPNVGVPEDPVTGSAHCTLIPYWSARLGKTTLTAHQVSRRGGVLRCQDRSDRVAISGQAALYLRGEITW
jgi:PhzF family phenazine biosynthesis protein